MMDSQAVVCVKCGVQAGTGDRFCSNCGQEMTPEQMVCIHCGAAKQPRYNRTYAAPVRESKSRLAAGLLGILVGVFGVHNFYLGFTGKAIAQLLLTVLTCGIGGVASAIWGLVEGILILTKQINYDAQGIPLSEM